MEGWEDSRGDAVAEKDAGVRLCDDDLGTGGTQSHRGVLSGGPTAKVVAADNDGILRLHLPRRDVPETSSTLPSLQHNWQSEGLNC